ncbi:alpha/beta hydrolase [Chitinophaga agrisoli]|uniref:Alpha/beta hydrolase n=1 Tax=Chitinophaga agrisoli TaxID=2607653 RepID=A0A5B2VWI9_9BACT|nr:alpha/beta hydrolase [Chitinophaga agrisoli]KAA2242968.1 alpha/beta hydrolase [Chitinophaga agrisoli]
MNRPANFYVLSLLLLILFACNNPGAKTPATPAAEPVKIDNQGVNIDYTDSRTGDTTLLFLHGWGINQTYWSNQVTAFTPRYRVVTLDLPGFGKSGQNRQSWTIEDYGKDVTAVLTKLDLRNVILIGHSMSGAIIVETALNNPTRVIGLIGVDNFKNIAYVETPADKGEADKFYNAARAHYKAVVTEYGNQALFAPSTDSLIRQRVIADISNSDSVIAMEALEKGDRYPLHEKVKDLKKTIYMINSDVTPTDTAAFRKDSIRYYLLNIGATGHYPMVEKPAEFNTLLQHAIDRIGQ